MWLWMDFEFVRFFKNKKKSFLCFTRKIKKNLVICDVIHDTIQCKPLNDLRDDFDFHTMLTWQGLDILGLRDPDCYADELHCDGNLIPLWPNLFKIMCNVLHPSADRWLWMNGLELPNLGFLRANSIHVGLSVLLCGSPYSGP